MLWYFLQNHLKLPLGNFQSSQLITLHVWAEGHSRGTRFKDELFCRSTNYFIKSYVSQNISGIELGRMVIDDDRYYFRKWIAPLSGFFPTHADLFTAMHSNHETKQSFKFQSDPSPYCFTIDVWKNCLFLTFILVLLYLILHVEVCRVLICGILGIGLF